MKYLKKFESYDDSDTMAKFQLVDADTEMAFDFNKEYITDPNHIKDLIEKYSRFYLKEESWGGGPPPKEFVDYFNQKFSKKKTASQRNFHPTINLIIETDDYGKLIIGFSIRTRKFVLYNWAYLECEDPTEYDTDVLDQIDKFVRNKLDKMSFDEVVSYLNLNIKNKIDWNWTN